MKIRQIKAFLAIVSTGGVRPAAKKLCLTPSTVAKSIGQLESDLGAPLFERSAPVSYTHLTLPTICSV